METAKEQPSQSVGIVATSLMVLYLVAVMALFVYGIVRRFEADTVTLQGGGTLYATTFFGYSVSLPPDLRLLILVFISGGLGSLVHALRSFFWYVGNRELARSWLLKYFLLPFVGSVLSVAFYFVLRGGLISSGSDTSSANEYGFLGMAILVGMFSEQAVLKLKKVADTLFVEPTPGADAKPQQ